MTIIEKENLLNSSETVIIWNVRNKKYVEPIS